MKHLGAYVKIALNVITAHVFGAVYLSCWNAESGTAWRWLTLAVSAVTVTLWTMSALSAAHSLTDATTESTSTENQ